jgi:hypothetical protein
MALTKQRHSCPELKEENQQKIGPEIATKREKQKK